MYFLNVFILEGKGWSASNMLVVVNQFVTRYKSCDVSETVIQLKQQQMRRVADNSVQFKIIFFF